MSYVDPGNYEARVAAVNRQTTPEAKWRKAVELGLTTDAEYRAAKAESAASYERARAQAIQQQTAENRRVAEMNTQRLATYEVNKAAYEAKYAQVKAAGGPDAQWMKAIELGLATRADYENAQAQARGGYSSGAPGVERPVVGEDVGVSTPSGPPKFTYEPMSSEEMQRFLATEEGTRFVERYQQPEIAANAAKQPQYVVTYKENGVEKTTSFSSYEAAQKYAGEVINAPSNVGKPIPGPGAPAPAGSVSAKAQAVINPVLEGVESRFEDVALGGRAKANELFASAGRRGFSVLGVTETLGGVALGLGVGVYEALTMPVRPLLIGKTVGGVASLVQSEEARTGFASYVAANPILFGSELVGGIFLAGPVGGAFWKAGGKAAGEAGLFTRGLYEGVAPKVPVVNELYWSSKIAALSKAPKSGGASMAEYASHFSAAKPTATKMPQTLEYWGKNPTAGKLTYLGNRLLGRGEEGAGLLYQSQPKMPSRIEYWGKLSGGAEGEGSALLGGAKFMLTGKPKVSAVKDYSGPMGNFKAEPPPKPPRNDPVSQFSKSAAINDLKVTGVSKTGKAPVESGYASLYSPEFVRSSAAARAESAGVTLPGGAFNTFINESVKPRDAAISKVRRESEYSGVGGFKVGGGFKPVQEFRPEATRPKAEETSKLKDFQNTVFKTEEKPDIKPWLTFTFKDITASKPKQIQEPQPKQLYKPQEKTVERIEPPKPRLPDPTVQRPPRYRTTPKSNFLSGFDDGGAGRRKGTALFKQTYKLGPLDAELKSRSRKK